MKNYILTISKDAINIYKQITIKADNEPDFWTCYNLARKYNCNYFSIAEF